jgi:hypothetical protein
MKAITAYQQYASRCRELAQTAHSSEERDILLRIADTWDWIARDYEPSDSAHSNADEERRGTGK